MKITEQTSECGKYIWGVECTRNYENDKIITFVLLRPTSDNNKGGELFALYQEVAEINNCSIMLFVFLFPIVVEDFTDLSMAKDPIGQPDDRYLETTFGYSKYVVACWGINGYFKGRDKEVAALIGKNGRSFGQMVHGYPHTISTAKSIHTLKPFEAY